MCFKTGLQPDDLNSVTAGQWRISAKSARADFPRMLFGPGLFLALLFAALPAKGDDFLSLVEAERLALADEPGRRALEARAEALGGEALAAVALPAPTLRLGLNNYPIERGDFSTEGMTSAGVTYRQAFPPGDVRQLRRERYDWEASAARRQGDARDREVRLRVREHWLDLYLGQRSELLLAETRPLFGDLLEVTRSLYAVGRKNQQDVVRAELELGQLGDRLIEARRQQALARARLSRWTGPINDRPVPDPLPALPAIPELATLRRDLGRHPRLEAADASIEARGRHVDLAEAERRPGWALDMGYAYRDGQLPDGQPRSDFVTVGVSLELPFLRRQALDGELQAALAARNALEWDREALRRELVATLDAEYAQWEKLGRRIDLYETDILRQAAANAEAAKLAYQSDTADFADVMRAAIDELNTRLEHLRLQVERARSQAMLAYLGGLDNES
jgi:outer membrane protein TolC